MKQILLLVIVGMFAVMASSVSATNLVLDPDLVTMATTDSRNVTACLFASGGVPMVGADIAINATCKDLNANELCDIADTDNPAGFNVTATQTPTNSSGCGQLLLETIAAATGQYAYRVNGLDGGVVVATEHGLVLVPEFTTIGAALVLAGAGLYVYRKKKEN